MNVVNALEFRIPFEVGSNDLNCHLNERLDVLGWEGILVTLAGLSNLHSDFIVIELLHLFHLCCVLLRLHFLGLRGCCRCKVSFLHFYMFKFICFNYSINHMSF